MFAGTPPERLIPSSSRQWICSRATGVLEVSIGTGRPVRQYPDHAALIALDLDLELPSLARSRSDVFHHALLLQGDPHNRRSQRAASPSARSRRQGQRR